MIGICMGLSVILIAFLCIRVFAFQTKKLEQGTYDSYGFYLMTLIVGCVYISDRFLNEERVQQIIILFSAMLTTGLAVACIGKQLLYDYKHKKIPFHRK
ncbi:hypothetical protein CN271_31290 [Bacillus cereus]|nr:hypothetical protein CON59_30560 [Bacillus cereus]PET36004.1 hypothetical protein CN523_30325 [Bacillus cereus]PEV82606.1 hypothetical protein CN429_13700 [Bacillus cereus]PFA47043.1 hypothetical protein CN389_26345 [Bacillus cereus]PFD55645.1 hypothetical protein CN271_31290 [Bacillus cereus]